MSLSSLDSKRNSCTDTSLFGEAWNEFEATAVATANVESSGPEAWRALAMAVSRLQAEATASSTRKLESSRTLAAQEVAFIKAECAKVCLPLWSLLKFEVMNWRVCVCCLHIVEQLYVAQYKILWRVSVWLLTVFLVLQELASNEKLIVDLSEALDTRGAEAAAALAAHERARQAIAQRDTREARVAAALARADAQTAKLEELCLRTERASGEHVSMLQRSVRDLRARCENLGEALSGERVALAAVAAKAEALATRERDARGAETEATAEASGLAQKLAEVRVRAPILATNPVHSSTATADTLSVPIHVRPVTGVYVPST